MTFPPSTTATPPTKNVFHAGGELGRLLVGRVIGDGIGIEDDEVGVGADLHSTFLLHLGDAVLESLGGHERHFTNGFGEGQRFQFADVAAENLGVGAGGAWVAFAFVEVAVAGDDGERMIDDVVDDLLGVLKENH